MKSYTLGGNKTSIERIGYSTEWYDTLVSDCRAIIDRAKVETGVRLLKAKWELGNRILPDYERFGRHEYGNKTQRDLARELNISQQEISRIITFREEVGVNFKKWFEENTHAVSKFSWRKIVNDWLPKRIRRFIPKKIFKSNWNTKLIQRSGGNNFFIIPQRIMREMSWKAQDKDCQISPIPDKARNRVILQRVTFNEP